MQILSKLIKYANFSKSRSLEDFDDIMDDFHDNINTSAPDLSNLQIDN